MNRNRIYLRPLAILLTVVLCGAPPCRAQSADTTRALDDAGRRGSLPRTTVLLQVADGAGFHDPDFGLDTRDGRMSTAGVIVATQWRRYRSSLFAGVLEGAFVNAHDLVTENRTHLLLEWTSELSMTRLGGVTHGPSLDLFAATMLTRNEAADVDARQIGVGTRFALGNLRTGVTLFHRHINGQANDVRTRFDWSLPFDVRGADLRFLGYQDLVFGRGRLPETSGAPSLVVLSGALVHQSPDALQIGLRWFDHRSHELATSAPQIVIRVPL
jgi:hypothetical protein